MEFKFIMDMIDEIIVDKEKLHILWNKLPTIEELLFVETFNSHFDIEHIYENEQINRNLLEINRTMKEFYQKFEPINANQ